jgi:hypothetical protein
MNKPSDATGRSCSKRLTIHKNSRGEKTNYTIDKSTRGGTEFNGRFELRTRRCTTKLLELLRGDAGFHKMNET